jgi:hypothetical protein
LELGFSDDSNRYDGNKPYDHPHVVCTVCKKILDPDISALEDMTQELTRQKTGFTITRHRLDFFGICPDCLEMSSRNGGLGANKKVRRSFSLISWGMVTCPLVVTLMVLSPA